jgi:hypothetical protein
MSLCRFIGKYILLLSIPAVLMLFYNQSANWHYHILKNGTVVKHAHPYSNDSQGNAPFQKHQHTDLELIVLSQFSNLLAVFVILLTLAGMMLHFYRQHFTLPAFVRLKPDFLFALTFRGPPASIS